MGVERSGGGGGCSRRGRIGGGRGGGGEYSRSGDGFRVRSFVKNVFNTELSSERYSTGGDRDPTKIGGWGVGGGVPNDTLHTRPDDFCIQLGSDESDFNVL